MAERVLLIDDDERLASMLVRYLSERGVAADHRGDARTGLLALASGRYDALLLDVMLPDGDGFDLCRKIRATDDIPIVMLTARGDELDRIIGLELGADDYLPKSFNPRELLARLRAVLRRRAPPQGPDPVLRFGPLEVDRAAREVRYDGEVRPLTSHQLNLLLVLIERSGRVQSREQLLDALRGDGADPFDRSVDVHISRIRAAIEEDPKNPRLVKTVRGSGYVFTVPKDAVPKDAAPRNSR